MGHTNLKDPLKKGPMEQNEESLCPWSLPPARTPGVPAGRGTRVCREAQGQPGGVRGAMRGRADVPGPEQKGLCPQVGVAGEPSRQADPGCCHPRHPGEGWQSFWSEGGLVAGVLLSHGAGTLGQTHHCRMQPPSVLVHWTEVLGHTWQLTHCAVRLCPLKKIKVPTRST